jgi:hypothetical protein
LELTANEFTTGLVALAYEKDEESAVKGLPAFVGDKGLPKTAKLLGDGILLLAYKAGVPVVAKQMSVLLKRDNGLELTAGDVGMQMVALAYEKDEESAVSGLPGVVESRGLDGAAAMLGGDILQQANKASVPVVVKGLPLFVVAKGLAETAKLLGDGILLLAYKADVPVVVEKMKALLKRERGLEQTAGDVGKQMVALAYSKGDESAMKEVPLFVFDKGLVLSCKLLGGTTMTCFIEGLSALEMAAVVLPRTLAVHLPHEPDPVSIGLQQVFLKHFSVFKAICFVLRVGPHETADYKTYDRRNFRGTADSVRHEGLRAVQEIFRRLRQLRMGAVGRAAATTTQKEGVQGTAMEVEVLEVEGASGKQGDGVVSSGLSIEMISETVSAVVAWVNEAAPEGTSVLLKIYAGQAKIGGTKRPTATSDELMKMNQMATNGKGLSEMADMVNKGRGNSGQVAVDGIWISKQRNRDSGVAKVPLSGGNGRDGSGRAGRIISYLPTDEVIVQIMELASDGVTQPDISTWLNENPRSMVPAEYQNRGNTWVKSAMNSARRRGHYQRVELLVEAAQKAQEAGAEQHTLEVCFAPGDTGLTLELQADMEQDESVVVKSSEGHAWNSGVLVGSELLAIYNGSASTKDNGGISGWTKVSCMLLQ